VVGQVFVIVRDAHLAEELAQEAMVEMMDQWADRCDRTIDANIAWTVGIAARIVVDDALPGDARAYLRDLLERADQTPKSRNRIRAVGPRGAIVANKTVPSSNQVVRGSVDAALPLQAKSDDANLTVEVALASK
jgi:DNA-directed RNA polymerase specialized sigma24 family protein